MVPKFQKNLLSPLLPWDGGSRFWYDHTFLLDYTMSHSRWKQSSHSMVKNHQFSYITCSLNCSMVGGISLSSGNSSFATVVAIISSSSGDSWWPYVKNCFKKTWRSSSHKYEWWSKQFLYFSACNICHTFCIHTALKQDKKKFEDAFQFINIKLSTAVEPKKCKQV